MFHGLCKKKAHTRKRMFPGLRTKKAHTRKTSSVQMPEMTPLEPEAYAETKLHLQMPEIFPVANPDGVGDGQPVGEAMQQCNDDADDEFANEDAHDFDEFANSCLAPFFA